VDAAWQRALQTHAARIADPAVISRVVSDGGAVSKTRWFAKEGTPGHAGAVAAVKRALTVRVVPGTALIAVRVDLDPKTDAAVLTNTLCDAYLERCREVAQQHARYRIETLKMRAMELQKEWEDRAQMARHYGRPFGGDLQVSREQVSGAAARLKRLEEARLAPTATRPTTAGAEAAPGKDLEQLIKAAADDLAKTADAAAEFKTHHDSAVELAERLRPLRDDIEHAVQAEESREAGVRVVQKATVEP
jgi:hypothetical protein